MSDRNKTCPKCGSEYLSHVQICADCEVSLEWAAVAEEKLYPGEDIQESGWDGFPDGMILGHLVTDVDKIIEIYLGFLKEAGINFALLPLTTYKTAEFEYRTSAVFGTTVTGGRSGQVPVGNIRDGYEFMIFVSREDFDRAYEIIIREFKGLHPGQEHGFSREYEQDACPACGFALSEEAEQCPDCGLSFI